MKTLYIKLFALTTIAVSLIAVSGCKKTSSNPGSAYDISLATSATLGQYLVDKDGYALYSTANDFNGRTSCTGACLDMWPAFYVPDLTSARLGPGLDISDFDTVRVNGVVQLRYKTWPLYYFAPGSGYGGQNTREPSGETNGDGYGGVWFAAKPDYSVMLSDAQLVGNDGMDYKGDYTPGTGKTLFFTDAKGNTLYTFSKDSVNKNDFTKSDFSNNGLWPIYESPVMSVPSDLDKSLFGTITVFGRSQMTYKGWPLYYFGADNLSHGNTKGVSVPVPGTWKVPVKDMPDPPSK